MQNSREQEIKGCKSQREISRSRESAVLQEWRTSLDLNKVNWETDVLSLSSPKALSKLQLLPCWQNDRIVSLTRSYLPEPGLLVTWALLPGSLKTLISWTTEIISLDLMLGSGSWACWNIKIKYEAIHSTQYSWWLPTSCPHLTLPNFSTSANAVSFSTYSGFCKVITHAPPPRWSLNKLTRKFKPVCDLKRLTGSFLFF